MSSAVACRLFPLASRIQYAARHISKISVRSQTSLPKIEDRTIRSDPAVRDSWSNISEKVNSQLKENNTGRLFAVVMAAGKQRKITQDDVIILDNNSMQAELGDKIILNKVLLLGGSDFTLVGRPMLKPDTVRIEATIIEKTTSHPKISFNYIRRKNTRFFKLRKDSLIYLRINSIEFYGLKEQRQLS